MRTWPTLAAAAAALAAVAWIFWPDGQATAPAPAAGSDQAGTPRLLAQVTVPVLEGAALRGEAAFDGYCAACHGPNAAGLDGKGPPLVHKIYEPGHHGDDAIAVAAMNGARAHHWRFGDMPPVAGITRAEIADIIAYIRTLQRANGI